MHAVSRASALGTEGVCVTELCLMEAAREALPFQLTGGQERALDNVLRDMQGPLPMMCLLQVPASTSKRILQGHVLPSSHIVRYTMLISSIGSDRLLLNHKRSRCCQTRLSGLHYCMA